MSKPDPLAIDSVGNMCRYLNTGGTGTATFRRSRPAGLLPVGRPAFVAGGRQKYADLAFARRPPS